MATDYAGDTGNAEPALTRIAEAGFRHIQWIHHWRHDFVYTAPEIRHIEQLLNRLALSLYDIHAPAGAEKNWYSIVEYQRLAGVEIIKNRVDMCTVLGGSVIVVHTPPANSANRDAWSQLRKSLDELEEYCTARSVKIAVENRANDKFIGIRELFSEYESTFLGLCYDTGHGNIGGMGLRHLDSVKERLISLHLHDNDGTADQHKPVFSGTVDWAELVRTVAASPYDKFLTFETEMRRSGLHDEALFLEGTYRDGLKLLSMMEDEMGDAPAA
ncbi:MAG TPA: sugar phosphate isomerase/epimerase family protein [Coriobacteriia bacterium]|nr:sugar phosphate isomerase/epimerase family protein [Coriobacteriia bacterium]